MQKQSDIYPIYDQLLQRADKEVHLQQRSKVIWMTGLSGSGKSTIGKILESKLHNEGYFVAVLDGDNVRDGINNNLSFSEDDRRENIRRIAEISKLFVNNGVITINCFVSPTQEIRNLAREIIGADDFIEVFVNAPLEICEERDVKGLYKKARAGEIKDFTGVDAPYDEPVNADITVSSNDSSPEACALQIYEQIIPLLTIKPVV